MKKLLCALLALLCSLLMLTACGVLTLSSDKKDAPEAAIKPDEGYTLGGADIVQLNGFRSIDIEWVSGSVSVELYDGEGIALTETLADGSAVTQLLEWRVDEDDSTLDIRSQPHFFDLTEIKHLTVKLPRSMVLYELEIETTSADVSVDLTEEDTLTLSQLDVASVSGAVAVNAANADEISLYSTSGPISGSVRTLDLEAGGVSGSVELTLDVLPRKLDIETTSGPVALAIPDGAAALPLPLEFHTTSGRLSGDVPTYLVKNADWEIQTVSSDVRISTAP